MIPPACYTRSKIAEAIVSLAAFLTSQSPGAIGQGFAPHSMELPSNLRMVIRPNLILHFLFQLVTSELDVGRDNLLGLPIFAFSD